MQLKAVSRERHSFTGRMVRIHVLAKPRHMLARYLGCLTSEVREFSHSSNGNLFVPISNPNI